MTSCKELAQQVKDNIKKQVSEAAVRPSLAIITVEPGRKVGCESCPLGSEACAGFRGAPLVENALAMCMIRTLTTLRLRRMRSEQFTEDMFGVR